MFELDDCEGEFVSGTWSIGPSGTMRHKQTGMKVSTDEGITFEGHEYKLSPEDLEMDPDHKLGAGACGVVSKGVIKKTGQQVAIKTVKVDDKPKREQLLNDIKGLILAEGCPNLVQWYAGFVSKKNGAVNVVLEFMDLGSLADLKRRCGSGGVETRMLASVTQQIMLGLAHLHNKKVLHRDIKPENILHNRAGEVKLTDFGIAKDLDATLAMAGTFVGTVTYMSPERCLGEDYSFASDIWSVGMVIYELSTGRYPFADISAFPVLYEHLCEKPEPRLDEALFPPDLCSFVGYCLTRDVARRPDTFSLCGHGYVTKDVPSQEELSGWLATFC
jgi:serine/threonine protein kinase